MEKPERIKIDDIEYVRADKLKTLEGDIKIVVVDRGYVYVGIVEETTDFVKMSNAKNIRYWGTTKGLGELVNGPLENTKLDAVGTIKIPNRAIISIIDVDQKAWAGK